jgi:hypothetical protein
MVEFVDRCRRGSRKRASLSSTSRATDTVDEHARVHVSGVFNPRQGEIGAMPPSST